MIHQSFDKNWQAAEPGSFDQLVLEISTKLINCQLEHTETHINDALAALGRFGDKDRCYVFLFNDELTSMNNTYEWTGPGITAHKDDLQGLQQAELPWFFQQMLDVGYVAISDVKQLPPAAALEKIEFEREDIRSVICVGMYVGRRLIGFVGCDIVARQKTWTAVDMRQLRLVGDLIANTVARQRSAAELAETQQRLQQANDLLQRLANEDSLTGLANRRALDACLERELNRAQRHQHELTVMLIDVDHFKQFNDELGHLSGDAALQRIALELKQIFRRSGELTARFGGDEFIVVCPELSKADAVAAAERLLEQLKRAQLELPEVEQFTVSIGVTTVLPTASTSIDDLIRGADTAVYHAKSKGRARVFAD